MLCCNAHCWEWIYNHFHISTCVRTAAPCDIENSNKADGLLCRCNTEGGFVGAITWSGANPSGDCVSQAPDDNTVIRRTAAPALPDVGKSSGFGLHLLGGLFALLFVFWTGERVWATGLPSEMAFFYEYRGILYEDVHWGTGLSSRVACMVISLVFFEDMWIYISSWRELNLWGTLVLY